MSSQCFVAVILDGGGFALGVADRGVAGYAPTGMVDMSEVKTWEEAKRIQDECNARIGVDKDEATLIILSTMRNGVKT